MAARFPRAAPRLAAAALLLTAGLLALPCAAAEVIAVRSWVETDGFGNITRICTRYVEYEEHHGEYYVISEFTVCTTPPPQPLPPPQDPRPGLLEELWEFGQRYAPPYRLGPLELSPWFGDERGRAFGIETTIRF